MSGLNRVLSAGLAIAVFAGALGGLAAPARADRDDHHDRREWQDGRRDWREDEHRRDEWRHRRYDNQYYYGERAYVSPPIVYGPPPPPSGLNLLFNVR